MSGEERPKMYTDPGKHVTRRLLATFISAVTHASSLEWAIASVAAALIMLWAFRAVGVL